jgi:hypothetical protein
MEWWGYAIVAGSIVSQILAWAAKLRWSAEYKNAKEAQIKSIEETIKSKEAHVALLESEVKSLQQLTPMKMREYFVSSTQTLEEYIDSLQKKSEILEHKIIARIEWVGEVINNLADALASQDGERIKNVIDAIKSHDEERFKAFQNAIKRYINDQDSQSTIKLE